MSYKILGLDQSSKVTAHAVLIDGELSSHGITRLYSPSERKDGIEIDERIFMMYKSIRETIINQSPDEIFFEDTFLTRVSSPEVFAWLNRLIGGIICLCYDNHIPYRIFGASEWRKLIGMPCGRGVKREQEKAYSIQIVNDIYGLNLGKKEDDLADAINIARAGWIFRNSR